MLVLELGASLEFVCRAVSFGLFDLPGWVRAGALRLGCVVVVVVKIVLPFYCAVRSVSGFFCFFFRALMSVARDLLLDQNVPKQVQQK